MPGSQKMSRNICGMNTQVERACKKENILNLRNLTVVSLASFLLLRGKILSCQKATGFIWRELMENSVQ